MVTRNVEVEFTGDADDLERAHQQLTRRAAEQERQLARLERQMQSYERQTRRNEESQRRHSEQTEQQTRRMEGGMASLAAAGAVTAGAAAAAGAAFVSFAAVSVPSITKVLTAQEDLAGSWDGLSSRQKASALLVQGLADDYRALAESYEPQALATFNQIVGTARGLLPQLTQVVDGTAVGVQNFVGRLTAFAEGPEVAGFLDFAADTAPAALDQFGSALTTTGSLGLTLVQDLAPLGMSMLQLATGTLGAVNAIAQFNPMLSQLAISAVLLRAPITGAIAGIGGMATRMRAASGAAAGASVATRALNLASAAGPALYVAAGAGLLLLASRSMQAKTGAQQLAEALKETHKATGNNVAGYQALIADAMPRLQAATATLARLERERNEIGGITFNQTGKNVKAYEAAIQTQSAMTKVIDESNRAMSRVNSGADQLSRTYGITRHEALLLADAAGVDLSKSLDKNGQLTSAAAVKILGLKTAMDNARNPAFVLGESFKVLNSRTATLEQRVKALTDAYNAELGPALAVFNASITMKQGFQELTAQLKANGGAMKGNSAAALANQAALAVQIDKVWKLYDATYQQTQNTGKASAEVRKQIPLLYALAGNNVEARKQVDALARATGNVTGATRVSRGEFIRVAAAMGIGESQARDLWKEFDRLQKKAAQDISLDVYASGHWVGGSRGLFGKGWPRAMGGPIPAQWAMGPGGPTSDDVPIWASVGEHMIPTAEVQKAGGHEGIYRIRAAIRRGEVRGYASGGPISLTSRNADVGEVVRPIYTGIGGLVARIGDEFAAAWKKYAGSGGPVVAAARRWLGLPYSWGGGGIGGPSYGIGRGAGTWGFDCSGLTQNAWWAGRKIDIGGVTYTQHPNSVSIGEPRPGALGFPHMGHVVIASGRGTIIEAPYTGAHVREVGIGRSYDWRWPRAAMATGGPVDQAAGEDFLATGRHPRRVALDGLAGDPDGLVARMAGGGIAAGYFHGPTLLGERGTGGEAYIPMTPAKRARSEDLLADVAQRFGGIYAKRIPVNSGGPAARAAGPQTIDRHVEVNVAHLETSDAVDVDLLADRIAFLGWADGLGPN